MRMHSCESLSRTGAAGHCSFPRQNHLKHACAVSCGTQPRQGCWGGRCPGRLQEADSGFQRSGMPGSTASFLLHVSCPCPCPLHGHSLYWKL